MKLIFLTFGVFLAGVGIGSLIKYYDYFQLNMAQKLYILLILPFQTLWVALKIYLTGFGEVYGICRKSCNSKGAFSKARLFFKVAITGLMACFKYMPIIAGRIVVNLDKKRKNTMVHFGKKTFNDCFSVLIGSWSSSRVCMQRCYK